MDFDMKFYQHLRTVLYHKFLVMKSCFAVGLYWQGIVHDLSKFSFTEFWVGVNYYQGSRSPNNQERELFGYSAAWLHHKGRNKHHYEYWTDYSKKEGEGIIFVEMPKRYLVEMVLDRIAASKVYNKKSYTDRDALTYYEKGKDMTLMHKHTKVELERLLTMLAEKGERETFSYMKQYYKE